ncbi:MAG: hypothetical protein FD189_886 [Elusimicrobia bacterium]|nr:MAG: hypothetical protein FD154_965 [Elusimicrobiota bacterium]KAF0156746.1 MAG: hypothetical protein FD189_886 [Elusimicrobiota bacterium]
MRSKKLVYSLLAAAGLLAAVVGGLCLKYSPAGVMMSAVLAYDAVYVKLFENTPEEDALYTARAVSEKDLRLCREVSARYIRSTFPRVNCYREVVTAVADPAICREEEIMEYIGEEQCYITLAVSTGDAGLCERVTGGDSGMRDECYFDLAREKNDAGFCGKLSESLQREFCLESCAAKKEYDESPGPGPWPRK